MLFMKKRSFSETLNLLCESEDRFYTSDGSLNAAEIGRATKIKQATVYRMLQGQSAEPSADNARKLCSYFGVTREQLVGDRPIPVIDGIEGNTLSALTEAFQKVAQLPAEDQALFLQFAEGLIVRSEHRKR